VIPTFHNEIPFLTTEQMIEVDRAMVEDYGIGLTQMMENAGHSLASLARDLFFEGDVRQGNVSILAGSGGNGGGALVAARRLHNYGARVQLFITRPASQLAAVTARQLDILKRMGLPHFEAGAIDDTGQPDLIIDGIIGYSLQGPPRGAAESLIKWANRQKKPILSLDVPSGVDSTSGVIYQPAIKATATMTLALPKLGLKAPGARDYAGQLFLADISVPPELYARPGLDLVVPNIFARGDIVRLP
jgi:NAD(P)H-hydrate epimerase